MGMSCWALRPGARDCAATIGLLARRRHGAGRDRNCKAAPHETRPALQGPTLEAACTESHFLD